MQLDDHTNCLTFIHLHCSNIAERHFQNCFHLQHSRNRLLEFLWPKIWEDLLLDFIQGHHLVTLAVILLILANISLPNFPPNTIYPSIVAPLAKADQL